MAVLRFSVVLCFGGLTEQSGFGVFVGARKRGGYVLILLNIRVWSGKGSRAKGQRRRTLCVIGLMLA